MNKKTLFLVEIAVFAALALLLDMVSNFVFSRIWPQGGSVSIAMVPVFLMAFRWGLKGGLLTGFLLGLLQVALGMTYIIHPLQGFIDYFLAFTVVGLAGIFAKGVTEGFANGHRGKAITNIILGVFVGSFLRFLCHFATGIIYFSSSDLKGFSIATFSAVYNGTYMLPSFILCSVVVVTLYTTASRVLVKKMA
ncbi:MULTISPECIES: energy-coupled thiamine transporter ThiT [Bacillus]|uniref:energy-coupled thiamine transporter ThiT n=1 Tax=Bacillus TaxID=1386 RepID=UPI0002E7F257|nr:MULTISPECIES: energy-coupled thiamine transporter ThiT [Bacillus]